MSETNPAIEVVEENETPTDVMQRVGCAQTNEELGFAIRDTIDGTMRYLTHYEGTSLWMVYRDYANTDSKSANGVASSDLNEYINLHRGEVAVVPVSAMPEFGDGSLNIEQIFE